MALAAILIVVALALSAFFSGSETAFVTANQLRVEVAARQRRFVGPIVLRFLHDPATLLTTTLVGNNLALVAYSTLLALFMDPPLDALFVGRLGIAQSVADALILATQTLVGSAVVLVFGEIIPKSVMREQASRSVFILAVPLRVTYFVLLPLIKLAGFVSELLISFAGRRDDQHQRFIRRDFEMMIQESRQSGDSGLDAEESTLLANVFAMSSIRVKESMVPRTDMVAVDEEIPLDMLLQEFLRTGHSKLPVYRDNIDHIVGVAFAYDMFDNPGSLADMVREPSFIPETKLSKEQLKDFLDAKTSIAIVIDEYGGTAGLVTAEDLLEELFGDIQDEFDTEQNIIRRENPDTLVVAGRLELDELEEKFDWKLPDGDYETLAGFLLEHLGSIPATGDEAELAGFRFSILEATANRVELIRLRRLHP